MFFLYILLGFVHLYIHLIKSYHLISAYICLSCALKYKEIELYIRVKNTSFYIFFYNNVQLFINQINHL